MSFIPLYDVESLNEQQRQDYIKNVCNHMGVPPELNLVMLTYLDENEGPRRLVAYAKRGATEIIRNNRGIHVTDLRQERIGGSVVWTATGKDNTGRQEMSSGAKYIDGLIGKDLDDAIMTAQTRACRRMTLQFVGAGVLDESEVNPAKAIQLKETSLSGMTAAPQPTVQPSNEPGKDITLIGPSQDAATQAQVAAVVVIREAEASTSQEDFSKRMEALRADAIAQLNAKAAPVEAEAPVRKPRKPRGPNKPKVDMGPSEPPTTVSNPALIAPILPVNTTQTMTAPTAGISPVLLIAASSLLVPPLTAPVSLKPRLSPEQVKPYRQRQFKFVNELEMNGFIPKEGMGNQDKLRAFAGIMFPEVTNFNELTIDQWEKYLTAIETKLTTVGPKETIKYIEDAIGI
jgi:hypothetical protein